MNFTEEVLNNLNIFIKQSSFSDRILMDFKPENIIVMPQNGPLSLKFLQLKLIDFADSLKVQGPNNQPQMESREKLTASWPYAAPEIHLPKMHGKHEVYQGNRKYLMEYDEKQ